MAEALRREPLPLTCVTPGAVVVRQGEVVGRPLVVVAGALRESCLSREGRELVLGVLGPGDLVTPSPCAAARSTIRAIRVSRLREAVSHEMVRLLATREERSLELACDLAWLDVTARLERRLEDLASRFGRPGPGGELIDVFLTQGDLAGLVGASRERVNRALGTLARRGRIRLAGRGRYVLRPPLRALA